MFRSILMLSLLGMMIMACQEDGDMTTDMESLTVESIAAEELPASSQEYINENFAGELVTSAYRITSTSDTFYEARLTNSLGIVFGADGRLEGLGEAALMVDCAGVPRDGMADSLRGGGPGRHGGKHGGMHGGRPRGHKGGPGPDRPVEVALDSLPSAITDYLTANYPDGEVLVSFLIANDSVTEYHVLIKDIGALIFDGEGTFIELKEPQARDCGHFEELAIEDLPAAVTDYIATNYPENEIVKARTGTRDDATEIHVVVGDVGVLIFDEAGNFVELKTCGMNRG